MCVLCAHSLAVQIACLLMDRYANEGVTALEALSFYAKQRCGGGGGRVLYLVCTRNVFDHSHDLTQHVQPKGRHDRQPEALCVVL
jgi:hypothetical protein